MEKIISSYHTTSNVWPQHTNNACIKCIYGL